MSKAQFQPLSTVPQATSWILMARITVFLFLLFVHTPTLLGHLVATPTGTLTELHLWQLVTSLFVQSIDARGVIQMLLDIVVIYWLGMSLEPRWGRRRFLALFFVAGLLSTLAACTMGLWMGSQEVFAGSTHAVVALLTAWGLLYRGREVLFFGRLPVRAHILAVILIGVPMLASLYDGRFANLVGDLVAVGAGLVLTRVVLDRPALLARARGGWLRKRYRVLDGGRKGPTYLN